MRLVIIGTGNVANVLGRMFFLAGHEMVQVVGRNRDGVMELAGAIKAAPCFEWQEIRKDAEVYILAVSDSVLYRLEEEAFLPQTKQTEARTSREAFKNGILVHTAGSVPATVLENIAPAYGVLYPLQTMRKGDDPGNTVPFLLNGNVESVIQTLAILASGISSAVSVTTDEQRAKIHLAATMVNNFSNHLFALAYDFCQKQGLDFSLLAPLIMRTAELAALGNPALLQTGPAARRDFVTLEKHERMLAGNPPVQKMYKIMSESLLGLI